MVSKQLSKKVTKKGLEALIKKADKKITAWVEYKNAVLAALSSNPPGPPPPPPKG